MENLTESRIRRILEFEPQLLRRTKKDRKKSLGVPHLPDTKSGETLTDVLAPQISEYFTDLNEDAAQFFRDRDRMFMIFHAIKAGGIQVLIEKYTRVAKGELFRSAISHPAVEAMLPQAIKNAENQIRQLQSVTPEEEDAVKNCMKEIEKSLSRRARQ